MRAVEVMVLPCLTRQYKSRPSARWHCFVLGFAHRLLEVPF
eukprot:COSAG02_NODE_31388_length_534_cov_1.062069_1_plen_40_part_01